MSKNNDVYKALDQEAKTVVANIRSLADEILQMDSGTGLEKEEKPVEEKPVDETMLKPEEAQKGLVTTNSDSNTASTEEENEDKVLPESTNEAVSAVAKAILQMAKNQKTEEVKKERNPVLEALEGLTSVVKKNRDDMSELQNTVKQLFDGMGITQQFEIVKKSKADEQVRKSQPIVNNNNQELYNLLSGLIKKEEKPMFTSNNETVHKSLKEKDILAQLVAPRADAMLKMGIK
jgi:hypothetical protein